MILLFGDQISIDCILQRVMEYNIHLIYPKTKQKKPMSKYPRLLIVQKFLIITLMLINISLTHISCFPSAPVSSSHKTMISLHPAITETLYYLNAHDDLKGRSDYCQIPSKAMNLPSFGSSLTPNYEAIARQSPQFILTDRSVGNPLKALQRITKVIQFPWLTLADMKNSILKLGILVEKEQGAKKLIDTLSLALRSTVTSQSASVLLLMSGSDVTKGQLWFIRRDSLHGAAIEAAGYHNAAPQSFKGPPSMSLEQLLAQNPDFILFVTAKKLDQVSVKKISESLNILPSLSAVKNKRVGVLNDDHLLSVGPHIIHLVDSIRTHIHSLQEHK